MNANDEVPYEKSLPEGADGDDSVVIDNGVYRIDVGETESGTWIWEYDGRTTLYHEFFALGAGGDIVASYNQDSIEDPFPDTVNPGEKASAIIRYTVNGVPLLVKRTVRMHPSEPTFTMKYDIANVGSETVDPWIAQYADFDDGRNDFWDDVGHYETEHQGPEPPEYVYVRDRAGTAYAGFSGSIRSDEHLVDDYPGYSEVLSNNFDNDLRYPESGSGDAVVAMKWDLNPIYPGENESLTVQWGARNSKDELTNDLEVPEHIETSPPIARQTATATTYSFIPGLSEHSADGGDAEWSTLPNGKVGRWPRDFKLDKAFIGDQLIAPPRTVRDFVTTRKREDGINQDLKPWRLKHDVAVQFKTDSDKRRIPADQEVAIWVNEEEGDGLNLNWEDDESPDYTVDTFVPGGSDPPYTVVEEDIIGKELHPIGRNFNSRTMLASTTERWIAADKREFQKDGEAIDGIRVATIYGHSDPYADELATDTLADIADHFIYVSNVPKVYTWIELTVLADGTTLLRVPDASIFPKHAAYVNGAAGEVEYPDHTGDETVFSETPQSGDRVDQTQISVIPDKDASSDDDTYSVAINETSNNVFELFNENAQGTGRTPWNTSHLHYLYEHREKQFLDNPVMVGGFDETGTEMEREDVKKIFADSADIEELEPLSPFEAYYH